MPIKIAATTSATSTNQSTAAPTSASAPLPAGPGNVTVLHDVHQQHTYLTVRPWHSRSQMPQSQPFFVGTDGGDLRKVLLIRLTGPRTNR